MRYLVTGGAGYKELRSQFLIDKGLGNYLG